MSIGFYAFLEIVHRASCPRSEEQRNALTRDVFAEKRRLI